MPLVKAKSRSRKKTPTTINDTELEAILKHEDDIEIRADCIRNIRASGNPRFLFSVALSTETHADNIELIFVETKVLTPEERVNFVIPLIGVESSTIRNKAVETLQELGSVSKSLIETVLINGDFDEKIQALSIVPFIGYPHAEVMLCNFIESQSDPNLINCSLEALYEVGSDACLPILQNLQTSFADEALIQFSIDLIISRIK